MSAWGGGHGPARPPVGDSTLTTFGELRTAQIHPTAYGDFKYDLINSEVWSTTVAGTGASAAASGGLLTLSSGTDATGTSTVQLRRMVKYRPGMGTLWRGTAMFSADPGAGNFLLAGVGNPNSGYYFGYVGGLFGILHIYGGELEVRTLTVTTGSTHDENVTVTLDGNAKSVAVTNSGSTSTTAWEIASADYSAVGSGWTADAIGSTVYFVALRAEARAGSYSLSGTSAVGTFAQSTAGAANSIGFIPQTSWNRNTMPTLDPQTLNVYEIGFQYLGAGVAIFKVEAPDGTWKVVHVIEAPNSRTTPVLPNPNVHGRWVAANVSGSTSASVSGASMLTASEGIPVHIDPHYGVDASRASVTSGGTFVPVLSIRVARAFNGRACRGQITLESVSVSTEGTKPVRVRLISNGTLTAPVFANVSSRSIAIYDTSATAISGGTVRRSFALGKTEGVTIDLGIVLGLEDVLTVAIETSAGTPDITAGVDWQEDQ